MNQTRECSHGQDPDIFFAVFFSGNFCNVSLQEYINHACRLLYIINSITQKPVFALRSSKALFWHFFQVKLSMLLGLALFIQWAYEDYGSGPALIEGMLHIQ